MKVTRRFDASPDNVFAAFTEPNIAARWMWGGLGSNPRAQIDLKVGGRCRIAIDPPKGHTGWANGEDAMSGVFVEVDPPTRLVYTLHWEADVGYNVGEDETLDEVIIVDLSSDGEGTLVSFQHVGIPDDGISATEHGKAADAMFDLLSALVEQ